MKTCCLRQFIGVSFIGSTPILTCRKKRIKQDKAFRGSANIGKSTMG